MFRPAFSPSFSAGLLARADSTVKTRRQNLVRHKSRRYYARLFLDGKEICKSPGARRPAPVGPSLFWLGQARLRLMQISDKDVRFFENFGYLKLSQAFRMEIDWITSEFEQVFLDRKVVHDGTRRSCIAPFIDQRERLCTLLDRREHSLAQARVSFAPPPLAGRSDSSFA
jgi:hypothetical protein